MFGLLRALKAGALAPCGRTSPWATPATIFGASSEPAEGAGDRAAPAWVGTASITAAAIRASTAVMPNLRTIETPPVDGDAAGRRARPPRPPVHEGSQSRHAEGIVRKDRYRPPQTGVIGIERRGS